MVPGVPAAVAACLARIDLPDAHIEPLTPDASDRRYYRVVPAAGDPVVIALHASPFPPGSLPFTRVADLFARLPLPVPRVRDELADLGILVLDDLGDVTLQALTDSRPGAAHAALYEEAVDLLLLLQRRGRDLADPQLEPYRLAFDVEKLMWEMDFFVTHFLEGFRRCTFAPAARDALREALFALVEPLAAEPRVLCHRDYHSRNLMVKDGRLFIIDFQDARMGPNTYDLVSLLRDSYADLPTRLVEELMERFRLGTSEGETAEAFARRFRRMGLQRNLKALGTFGFQAVARDNPAYAQYVPRTLAHIRRSFEVDDRFAALCGLLVPHVPELR